MKILHIDTEKGWRGGQQQVLYLHQGLLDHGIESVIACRSDSKLDKICSEKGLPVVHTGFRNEFDFPAAFRLAKFCRQYNFQIIHTHTAHALALALWAKLIYHPIALIVARRVDFSVRKNMISILKYKNSYIDKIICVSEQIREVLLKDGLSADQLEVVHSGIDLNKFDVISANDSVRQEFGIQLDNFLIGTVAAFADHKDYPNLLSAARLVLNKNQKCVFMAVGSGKDETKIRNLAEELELGSKFIFAGFRKDVGRFLKSFDLFVLASKKEGLGTSILDAQSVGLPVVTTRTGGIPEIVDSGKNGWLVPPQDPEKLAEAISNLITDAQLRKTLSAGALQNVTNFSIERTVEKTIAIYEHVLNNLN